MIVEDTSIEMDTNISPYYGKNLWFLQYFSGFHVVNLSDIEVVYWFVFGVFDKSPAVNGWF